MNLNYLNLYQNITHFDIDNIDVCSQLKIQIQNQKLKDSGWRFDKIISLTKYFYKIFELNRITCVKIGIRCSAMVNTETNDEYCFPWSFLAYLHPFEKLDSIRVSNCTKKFMK